VSYIPRTLSPPSLADLRAVDSQFVCEPARSMIEPMDIGYVPLAKRTSGQLQANADELRRMAATATTAEVVKALLTLADRFTALAEKRRREENSGSRSVT
jgi:hypothetical protein